MTKFLSDESNYKLTLFFTPGQNLAPIFSLQNGKYIRNLLNLSHNTNPKNTVKTQTIRKLAEGLLDDFEFGVPAKACTNTPRS